MISWSHFPAHKGRISGIIISGFGFGTTVFNLIGTSLINPDNRKATEKHDGQKYFSRDVTDNLPGTLRILALCYFCMSRVGILLLGKIIPKRGEVQGKEGKEGKQDQSGECPDLKTGLKSRQFFILFVLGLFSNIPGLYVATAYKTFGESKISSDDFLAITGSVGSVFNGSFRYVWPQIMDKTKSFKSTILILMLIMLPLLGSFYYVAASKPMFLIWVCGIYACEGGLATLFPSVIVKCFGKM